MHITCVSLAQRTINFPFTQVRMLLFAWRVLPFALVRVQDYTVSPFASVILCAAVPVGEDWVAVVCPPPRAVKWCVSIPKPRLDVCEVLQESGYDQGKSFSAWIGYSYNDVIWLQLPECFEASYCIQSFFFCEESLARDTIAAKCILVVVVK